MPVGHVITRASAVTRCSTAETALMRPTAVSVLLWQEKRAPCPFSKSLLNILALLGEYTPCAAFHIYIVIVMCNQNTQLNIETLY